MVFTTSLNSIWWDNSHNSLVRKWFQTVAFSCSSDCRITVSSIISTRHYFHLFPKTEMSQMCPRIKAWVMKEGFVDLFIYFFHTGAPSLGCDYIPPLLLRGNKVYLAGQFASWIGGVENPRWASWSIIIISFQLAACPGQFRTLFPLKYLKRLKL